MAKTAAREPDLDDLALNIFTDGSSFGNPRRGGFAYRIITFDEAGQEVCDDTQGVGREGATNQEMELLAVIEALENLTGRHPSYAIGGFSKIVFYTDSRYVQENKNTALNTWQTNGWCDRNGDPVRNADLWKRLVKAILKARPKRVDIEWVKGHKASAHNKAVDKLAKKSANAGLEAPIKVQTSRRKLTSKATEAGSIVCEGQRLMLRIVGEDWLSEHHLTNYRCEVMSSQSPYFQNIDWIASDDPSLRATHVYSVRLSDGHPRRIAKVFHEIVPPIKSDDS